MRIDTNEVKELMAAAYHVDAKSIKFWNGKYEFDAKETGNESRNSDSNIIINHGFDNLDCVPNKQRFCKSENAGRSQANA